MTLPLTGTRVLDLGDEPVALSARLLADLGADVIRVEQGDGDDLRLRGPFVDDAPGVETGLAHILYNAGKRSLALNLAEPEAWKLVAQLAEQCQVLIAPLNRSGACRPFLKEAAAKVGVVQPVFRRGSDDQATDLIGIAAGGQLYLNGYFEDPPNHPAGNLAYKQLALATALAAMTAILQRAAGHPARLAEVCMQEAVMTTTIQSANENYWHWHQQRPHRRGLANLGGQTVFQAGDGRWVSFYQHPPSWPAFANWIQQAFGDSRFCHPEWDDMLYRMQQNDEVVAWTEKLCATMDRDTLVLEGQARSILVVPVQGVADIANDPHLRQRGFYQRVWYDHLQRELEVIRAPFSSSAYEVAARPAPALGQHSRELLRDHCGIDDTAFAGLLTRGIVREPAREMVK